MATAATNQHLPSFGAAASGEGMEISDAEQNYDDIDIDIDLTVDPSHHEDENMADDRSEHNNRDDIMLDGEGFDDVDGMNTSDSGAELFDERDGGYVNIEAREASQGCAFATHNAVEVKHRQRNEDYIDYDDAEVRAKPMVLPEHAPEQPTVEQYSLSETATPTKQHPDVLENPVSTGTAQLCAENHDPVMSEIPTEKSSSVDIPVEDVPSSSGSTERSDGSRVQHASAEAPSKTVSQPTPQSPAKTATDDGVERPAETAGVSDQAEDGADDGNSNTPASTTGLLQQQANLDEQSQPPEKTSDLTHSSHDPEIGVTHEHSQSATPLHPAVVVYENDEISLFPADDSEGFYFLHDKDLAHRSMRTLMHECRGVLGDTVWDGNELEIEIPDLGLCLTEDSDAAVNTSFANILDVYLKLHQLDGCEVPGPLYMQLNTRIRFKARMDALLAAVADGKGLSQLVFPRDVTDGDTQTGSEGLQEDQQSTTHDEEPREAHRDRSASVHLSGPEYEEAGPDEKLSVNEESTIQSNAASVEQHESEAVQSPQATHDNQQSASQYLEESLSSQNSEARRYPSALHGNAPTYDPEQGDSFEVEHDVNKIDVYHNEAEDSHENAAIDHHDPGNTDEARDDASFRSSTLQGDDPLDSSDAHTPVHEGGAVDSLQKDACDGAVSTPPATEQSEHMDPDQHDARFIEQDHTSEGCVDTGDWVNATREGAGSDPTREVAGHGGSSGSHRSSQEYDDAIFVDDEWYEDDPEDDGAQNTRYEEVVYEEKHVAVSGENASDGPGSPHGSRYDDDDYDDSNFDKTIEDFLEGQSQPNDPLPYDDGQDTIDYDDDELPPHAPVPPGGGENAASASPPIKRGRDALGHDDQSEHSPKRHKSD